MHRKWHFSVKQFQSTPVHQQQRVNGPADVPVCFLHLPCARSCKGFSVSILWWCASAVKYLVTDGETAPRHIGRRLQVITQTSPVFTRFECLTSSHVKCAVFAAVLLVCLFRGHVAQSLAEAQEAAGRSGFETQHSRVFAVFLLENDLLGLPRDAEIATVVLRVSTQQQSVPNDARCGAALLYSNAIAYNSVLPL